MWSLYKPPLTNWILLKFLNYKKKKSSKKLFVLKELKMLVAEKTSLYLLKNSLNFLNKYVNFFLKIKNFNFLSLNLPLSMLFCSTIHLKEILIEKLKNFNFWVELINTTLLLYFNWTAYEIGIPLLNFFKKKNNFFNFSIKNLLFYLNKDVYSKNFSNFRFFDTTLFYNTYYYLLLLLLFQKTLLIKKVNINKKIYYYGLELSSLFIFNKYEQKIYKYNKYLTMQKGFSKITRFFFNRHYLFSTSTQLIKFSTFLKYKFFFKNFFLFFKKKREWFKVSLFKEIKLDEKINSKSGIFLWNRNLPILPYYVNKIFYVHTGNWFHRIWIVPAMVGYKFGSFSFTWKILAKNYGSISTFKNVI